VEVASTVRRAVPDRRVLVVAPGSDLVYRPWLVYLPAGRLKVAALQLPMSVVADRAGFAFQQGQVAELQLDHVAHRQGGAGLALAGAVPLYAAGLLAAVPTGGTAGTWLRVMGILAAVAAVAVVVRLAIGPGPGLAAVPVPVLVPALALPLRRTWMRRRVRGDP
jgi:hypothetical protein